ncbi:hypothetical protein KGF51_18920 [Clostridioides sp. ZZV14-6045]|uniref:recombinase family protein n=2 Tax=Clostridioides TaxID=1870884 RepID=UPI001D11A009|nr:hypothetical protein [Clostridioides sp. ZZV14-6045]
MKQNIFLLLNCKLLMTMIGAINEFERTNLLERKVECIIIAKQKGKHKGSKNIVIENFEEYYNKYINKRM